MATASPQLVWELVKGFNSAQITRAGKVFSQERFNLRSANSFKHSGFANPSAVDVSAHGKVVTLSIKSKSARSPSATKSQTLAKGFRQGARAVRSATEARKDLTNDAVARFSALKRAANRPATAGVKKPRRRNTRQ